MFVFKNLFLAYFFDEMATIQGGGGGGGKSQGAPSSGVGKDVLGWK